MCHSLTHKWKSWVSPRVTRSWHNRFRKRYCLSSNSAVTAFLEIENYSSKQSWSHDANQLNNYQILGSLKWIRYTCCVIYISCTLKCQRNATQVSHDHRSYERNLSNCVEKPENATVVHNRHVPGFKVSHKRVHHKSQKHSRYPTIHDRTQSN